MTESDKLQIITNVVCDYFKLEAKQLRAKSRKREITEPRYTIFYLARNLTRLSLESIGREFRKDHCTVIHGEKLIGDLIRFNGYGEITSLLAERANIGFNNFDEIEFERWVRSMGTMITNQN